MSVYKEGFHAITEIKHLSRQVFPDAADYGVPVAKDDRIWNLAHQVVDTYGVPGSRKVNRYMTGVSVESVIELRTEGDRKNQIHKFKLTYVSAKLKEGKTGYITAEEV